MKILTIGNSFSQNSTRFLPQICENGGVELTIGRAVIGGCSLERHWNNAAEDAPAYNAAGYGEGVTLRQLLESDEWDYVTMQQASHFSWKIGTFHPFLEQLSAYVREHAPGAEIIVQQTWAYRTDNPRLLDDYKISQAQMFLLLKQNYDEMAAYLGAKIMPVGEAFRLMQEETGDATGELTRLPDGPSHANKLGEYIGGLVWYAVMTGGDIDAITYVPEEVDAQYVAAAKKCAKAAVAMYNK